MRMRCSYSMTTRRSTKRTEIGLQNLAGAGCAPGGGNAIIRPYQCKTPPRAAGIPTGPNYDSLTPEVKQIIDEAIATITSIAVRVSYKRS